MTIFLTGPTASGKTSIGIEFAQQIGAEIISLDSMAIYRRMDIGTAKPTPRERFLVKHYMIDIVEPSETYSLASYLAEAERIQSDILSRGKEALFVGGTPLYLKGLIQGIFDGPPADMALRAKWSAEEEQTPGILHQKLASIDPNSAIKLHPNDTKRIIRALEIYTKTGKPISFYQTQFQGPLKNHSPLFVLTWNRETLYKRINLRVDQMMKEGLLDEVRSLLTEEKELSQTASAAVGYRELIAHLQGTLSLNEAVEKIKQGTRNFAKRQMTWFRSFPHAQIIQMEETPSVCDKLKKLLSNKTDR